MFRYEYQVPTESDAESASILSSPSVSATENLMKLLRDQQILERMRKRKKYLKIGACVVFVIISFTVLFSTLHTNVKPLQDLYPEKTEKMTVVFPDSEPLDFIPVTPKPIKPAPTTPAPTTPIPKIPAPLEASTKKTAAAVSKEITPIPSSQSANSADITIVSTLTTPAPTTKMTESPTASPEPFPECKLKTRRYKSAKYNLDEKLNSNEGKNAISLLDSMGLASFIEYTEYTCDGVFRVELTLCLPDNKIKFGPIYGVSKRESKKRIYELAAHHLYSIDYPETGDYNYPHPKHCTLITD